VTRVTNTLDGGDDVWCRDCLSESHRACEVWVERVEARAVEMLVDEAFRVARIAARSNGVDGRKGVVDGESGAFGLAGCAGGLSLVGGEAGLCGWFGLLDIVVW
jgi:hypothetical protein